MATRFRNLANGYEETTDRAGLWCLLFGFVYFAVKGVWTHAVAGLALAIVTAGASWFVYPFFAQQILEKHYLRNGWVPSGSSVTQQNGVRQCPFCAEFVRAEAVVCRHCGRDIEPIRRPIPSPDRTIQSDEKIQSDEPRSRIGPLLAVAFVLMCADPAVVWYSSQFPELEKSSSFTWLIVGLPIISLLLLMWVTVIIFRRWQRKERIGKIGWAVIIFWALAFASTAARVMEERKTLPQQATSSAPKPPVQQSVQKKLPAAPSPR
jgi:hypothetical protein